MVFICSLVLHSLNLCCIIVLLLTFSVHPLICNATEDFTPTYLSMLAAAHIKKQGFMPVSFFASLLDLMELWSSCMDALSAFLFWHNSPLICIYLLLSTYNFCSHVCTLHFINSYRPIYIPCQVGVQFATRTLLVASQSQLGAQYASIPLLKYGYVEVSSEVTCFDPIRLFLK